MRYFIRLSFDGSKFHGWQIQENAHSVQAELNGALALILKKKNIDTLGCGRTDTGVHARKFFVHFESDDEFDSKGLVHHLNALLPPSIAIHSLFPVADQSHARFSAISRTYVYNVYQQKNPFLKDYSYYFPHTLDVNRMNHFAAILKDHTDFSCFSKSRTQTKTNNCVITFAEWKFNDEGIQFTITADRFLRNMVRAIVGTLLDAGMNKIDKKQFEDILESKNRSEAGFSVPAHGLFLADIIYPFPVY